MENLDILLTAIATATAVGLIFTRMELRSERAASKRAIAEAYEAKALAKSLREDGIALPPTCEHCGEVTINSKVFQELVDGTTNTHVFSCPKSIASVPAYAASLRKEKGDMEELQRLPVEVVLESHKTVAEEARRLGVTSISELKAAKHKEAAAQHMAAAKKTSNP